MSTSERQVRLLGNGRNEALRIPPVRCPLNTVPPAQPARLFGVGIPALGRSGGWWRIVPHGGVGRSG